MYKFNITQRYADLSDLNGEANILSSIYLDLESLRSKVYRDKSQFAKDITEIRESIAENPNSKSQSVLGPVVASDKKSIDIFLLKSSRKIRVGKLEKI